MRRFSLWLLLLLGLTAAAGYWRVLEAPGPHESLLEVDIPRGAGLRVALNRLAEGGALRHPRVVEVWVRTVDPGLQIRFGRYEIAPHASAREILGQLADGKVLLERLTIIEGQRFAEFRAALRDNPYVEQRTAQWSDAQVMEALGVEGVHPEGRFFPDTYKFAAGTSDLELLTLAYERMRTELTAAWAARDPDVPVSSADELLTLASIVEKESALAAERPRIAGVFVNRLRRGMRLQTDPTVIYGLGEAFDGNLRRRDLTTDTPYNTYTRSGLPPTPIALPSRESLLATARPLATDELFFVATGEGDGAHRFSKTYAEHREAVQAMLQRQRARAAEARAAASSPVETRPLETSPP